MIVRLFLVGARTGICLPCLDALGGAALGITGTAGTVTPCSPAAFIQLQQPQLLARQLILEPSTFSQATML